MSSESSEVVKTRRIRGRPRTDSNSQVMQRLLDATEELLRSSSHYDLTERKIAEAAGTTEPMIHYYFLDKNGLLFALLVDYYKEISDKLKALDEIDPKSPSATRQIVDIVMKAYYSKYWIMNIAMSEFPRKESPFRVLFMKKFAPRGVGLYRIQQVVERLIDSGAYDRKNDPFYIALGLMTMIMAPLTVAPMDEGLISVNQMVDDRWSSYVADLFHRKLTADPADVAKDHGLYQ